MHGEGGRESECRNRGTDPDAAEQLIDAAWAALIAGRPEELRRVHRLLESPPEPRLESPLGARGAPESEQKLARLQLLLEHTARNLRILRGNYRPSEW